MFVTVTAGDVIALILLLLLLFTAGAAGFAAAVYCSWSTHDLNSLAKAVIPDDVDDDVYTARYIDGQ